MHTLRPNQIDPVERGVEYFTQKTAKPSIIVAPTAFGKSIIIAHIAKRVGERMLVIQPSKELLEQNYEKYVNLGGDASIYSASMGEKEIGNVTYATIGSVVKVAPRFKELGISKVIIDECDRFPRETSGMLRRFLSGAKITHVLGLTATPLKLQTNLDKFKQPFSKLVMLTSRSKKGNFFKDIIYVAQIQDMVENGYWSRIEYQSYDFKTGDLVYNTTGADFTAKSMKQAWKRQSIADKIVKKVHELHHIKSILIAVPSIDEAKELSARLPSCEALYSGMPTKERHQIISEFKSGQLRCIAQVNILSIGFDYPELSCIITGRPTASLGWWYQFVGRVTRIHPDKEYGLVVDFVGSVPKFGRVEDLYFEKDGEAWKMYGEGDKLITGIPLTEIGLHIKGKPSPQDLANSTKEKVFMPFGKWSGQEVKELPAGYRNWILNNTDIKSGKLYDELIRLKNIGI